MCLSEQNRLDRLLAAAALCLAAAVSNAAELQPETAAAFDRYIRATEARLARSSTTRGGSFLLIDAWPQSRRAEAYAELRQGRVLTEQLNASEEGRPIEVPNGLIHDWVGLVFIPGATLERALALVQDYNSHHKVYAPDVRRARLLEKDGDHFKVYLQLYKESLVTVVMNAHFNIRYERLGASRAVSRVYSTRLAEVADFGEPSEHERPVDDGHGFLWRLYSYWRFEAKDGGVYVQLQSIGLSRGVPFIFAWLVNPLLRSIPRGTIESLLNNTRKGVLGRPQSARVEACRPVRSTVLYRTSAPHGPSTALDPV